MNRQHNEEVSAMKRVTAEAVLPEAVLPEAVAHLVARLRRAMR